MVMCMTPLVSSTVHSPLNNTSILETQLNAGGKILVQFLFPVFGELVATGISNPEILGLDVYM